ncbi:carboxylating nicotinate-nucleotide diphosphorylase [Algoriphagus hitonicola]|uniref:Probable nicotinate-nucleotide pyrophosphorylase [carboxylating] n=1 Tax=Algoriphagus hitonicola TaxID=435880 RepID=A0A1I2QIT8_9BACT|nr:carboxylating nicotinate-nucleotide diphosphorylase [Algoriphagus hitonicola]SFG28322.1 nicotinate-nucleotide pyrophosphorylase [carboxylating] [Algoriphagus hitonicola]
MNPPYLTAEALDQFIQTAIAEDIGPGDYSSLASIPSDKIGKAQLIIKNDGIIAGVEIAQQIFKTFDERLTIDVLKNDGEAIAAGDIALIVSGPSASILSAERLVLNCMQRMSGIATFTHLLTQKIIHTKARLMDTRKTTPNFRLMEKWAVHIGGGVNHRFALYDMIMLKDNHVDFAGGIQNAVRNTQKYLRENNLNLKIEVETRNFREVQEVLAVGGVDFIMLDNMDYNTMRKAVALVDGKMSIEASGGITEETLAEVAECGVDFISMGALTYGAKALDMSLKAF